MKNGFAEDFTLSALKQIIYEQTFLSPSYTKKYDVYFKRYLQTCVKETLTPKGLREPKWLFAFLGRLL
jgi:hypothetical protein